MSDLPSNSEETVLRQRPSCAATHESIDYIPPVNRVSRRVHAAAEEKRHLYGYSGHTASVVVVTALSGVLIGITGVSLQTGIEYLVWIRNLGLQPILDEGGFVAAAAAFLAAAVALVALTSWCVQRWAPRAAGAGVAAVMALLNGCSMPGLLRGRVFFIKYLGTVAARIACLALGPEGPMVHLGATIASLMYASEHHLLDWGRRTWRTWLQRGHRSRGDGTPAPAADYSALAAHGVNGGIQPQHVSGSAQPTPTAGGAGASLGSSWLYSAADHREVCSAGAAAGLAAAFGAPIGGVLFSLEEASTHWSRKTMWRCFLCTIASTFTLAQLHPRSATGMLQLHGLYSLSNVQWLQQLPFVVLASAGGGLLGAVFNLVRIRLRKTRTTARTTGFTVAWASGVAAITVLVVVLLPAVAGRCLEVPAEWAEANVVRMHCEEGRYNDLATALLADSVWVIRSLLGLGSDAEPIHRSWGSASVVRLAAAGASTIAAAPGDSLPTSLNATSRVGTTADMCSLSLPCFYSARSLALLCASYLLLMCLASSSNVPGGLFMPAIMVGASWGALFGLALLTWLPSSWDIQPGLYALLAATACLGGVFRSSISLAVIVVEGTRGIDFLFGIIIAVVVSNYVAHWVHPHGVYESELQKDGTVFFLRPEPPHALRSQTAGSIMAAPAAGFPAIVPAVLVIRALQETWHSAFVVFPAASADARLPAATAGGGGSSDGNTGPVEGLITRYQLLVLLREQAWCDAQGRYLDVPADVPAWEAQLYGEMQQAQALSNSGAGSSSGGVACGSLGSASAGLKVPPPPAGAHLNLLPFLNLAPLTVRPETPAPQAYKLFLSMSLRHLVVVDSRGRPLGMITRKDLDHAAGKGWWRVNPEAPPPDVGAHTSSSWYASASAASAAMLRSLSVPTSRLITVLSHQLDRFSVSPAGSLLVRSGSSLARTMGAAEGGDSPSPRRPRGGSDGSSASPDLEDPLLRQVESDPYV